MSERFSLDQIQEFWTKQANKYGKSAKASWSDHSAIEMEIREIIKYLNDGERVLDVGCANGYSTVQFAFRKQLIIKGIDYIPEMIEQARLRLDNINDKAKEAIEFDVGNILDLNEASNHYDKVVVTRVIINLGDWPRQRKGLLECVRVLKQGGVLLLSEATLQGWQQLNKFRREWCLQDIPMPLFNQYLDEDNVIKLLSSDMKLINIENFSSTYYVGTRILKPLLNQAIGSKIDVSNPDMEWNRWFSLLPSWGNYGVQKLFIFQKK